MRATDLPHVGERQHRSAHVARVRHHHGPRGRRDLPVHLCRVERAVRRADRPRERHPDPSQLIEGPHDGIVLHRGHDHVIPGTKHPLEHQVQRLGHVAREDHVRRIRPTEQLPQRLARLQHGVRRVIGVRVAPAAHVAADLGDVPADGIRHARRLGKGRARIVKVDSPHRLHRPSRRWSTLGIQDYNA